MKKFLGQLKKIWKPEPEEVNPIRDEAKIFTVLLLGERAAVFASAVVSGFAVAAWGWIFAGGYWDNLIFKVIVAIALLGAATYFTDVAIRYIVQKSAYDFFVFFRFQWLKDFKTNRFVRAMQFVSWAFLVGIGVGMFWFDYISVDAVRRPVAELVKQEKTINQDSARASVQAQETVRMAAVVAATETVAIDIAATKRQIKAEKTSIAASMGKDVFKGYNEKNGWVMKKFINPAFAKSARLKALNENLVTLEQNKIDLSTQRKEDLAYQSSIIAKTDAVVFADNQATISRNRDKVNSAENTMMYVGIFTKAGAMLIRILLVALFLAKVNKDTTGDGVVDYRDVTPAAKEGFLGG